MSQCVLETHIDLLDKLTYHTVFKLSSKSRKSKTPFSFSNCWNDTFRQCRSYVDGMDGLDGIKFLCVAREVDGPIIVSTYPSSKITRLTRFLAQCTAVWVQSARNLQYQSDIIWDHHETWSTLRCFIDFRPKHVFLKQLATSHHPYGTARTKFK